MKREELEALVRRPISDAEWLQACNLLEFILRHPGAEAVLNRCAERGVSVQATIDELLKLPPLS